MQLARWLESQLDNQVHTIDGVLALARYQLDVLKERYPAIYRVFVQSAFYDQAAVLTEQVEALRMDMTYQLERIKTDINMISEMRSRLLENEGLLFDSERIRASARIEAATDELTGIRDYITLNAADWEEKLKGWTERVQSDGGSAGEEDITSSLKRFLSALWKKYAPDGDGADPSVEEELRKLLKEQYAKYAPRGQSADAFADDAIALLHRIYEAHTVRYYYDSIATPEITWAKVNRRSNKVLGLELFGTFGRVNCTQDEPAYGITSFEAITGNPVRCFNDKYVLSGMGKNYIRTEVRGAMRCSDTEPKLYPDRQQRVEQSQLRRAEPAPGRQGRQGHRGVRL